MEQKKAMKAAKKWIKKNPMPAALEKGFKRNGWNDILKEVYERTERLVIENEHASKGLAEHLEQILPSIAFYEVLLKREGDKEKALEVFERYCFVKIEKIAKLMPVIMKIPGLYKKVPAIMEWMLDAKFGSKAGFSYLRKECENGFAADMTVCPYVETCKKYGCPELTQFFCKSDDYCYGNMHSKLVWGRTKTLGTGADCCDFKLYIKE